MQIHGLCYTVLKQKLSQKIRLNTKKANFKIIRIKWIKINPKIKQRARIWSECITEHFKTKLVSSSALEFLRFIFLSNTASIVYKQVYIFFFAEQIRNETNANAPIIVSHATSPIVPIIQQDREVTAYVGEILTTSHAERITLLCEIVGDVEPEILWYHDEYPLYVSINEMQNFPLLTAVIWPALCVCTNWLLPRDGSLLFQNRRDILNTKLLSRITSYNQ